VRYSNGMNNNTRPTVHLQGIGLVDAIAYSNVQPGDRLVYNYGAVYRAEAVRPAGKATIEIDATDERTGKSYTFRRRGTSLIGYIAQ
jgi:uncharacterized protein YndB with AHSA1/START domain